MNTLIRMLFLGLLLASCTRESKAPEQELPTGIHVADRIVQVSEQFTSRTEMTLTVRAFDHEGKPVDSRIRGVFVMPAMGSMAEMRAEIPMTGAAPSHRVPVQFDMAGKWFLALTVESGEKPIVLHYAVNTITADFEFERSEPPSSADATEVKSAPADGPAVHVPAARRQLIGVTFAPAEVRSLSQTVRAFGRVAVSQQSLEAVNLQVGGWVRKLYVNDMGVRVKKGGPLMTLYSPELNAAQEELLIAARSNDEALRRAAEGKLESLGMGPGQVRAVEERGRILEEVTIYSPRDGYVVAKEVVAGARVEAGMTAFQVGALGRVWVLADVYESDAPRMRNGLAARIQVSGGHAPLEGTVSYVYPTVDEKTRTLPVRIEIKNVAETLKPGMAVDVYIDLPAIRSLVVPKQAVLTSGEFRYVFVDRGNGYLEPRRVETAPGNDEWIRVTSGLSAGDRVSTAANFLLSSEAQLQNALPKWGGPPPGPLPEGGGADPHAGHRILNPPEPEAKPSGGHQH